MKKLKILFLLSLFCLLSRTSFSQPIFSVTDTNLTQTIAEIQQIYSNQMSISDTNLYNLIFPFVQNTAASGCPPPEPQIQQLGNGSVSFSWPPVSPTATYGYYYINLSTGAIFSSTTSTPYVSLNGLQGVYLFGFYTICDDGTISRSDVIIVDVDMLFPEDPTTDCNCQNNKTPVDFQVINENTKRARWHGRCPLNQYRINIKGDVGEEDYHSALSIIYDSESYTVWLLPHCDDNAHSSAEPFHVGSELETEYYHLTFYDNGPIIHFLDDALTSPSAQIKDCGCPMSETPSYNWTSIKNPTVQDFQVFPNPASDQIQVNYQLSAASSVQITLFDALGRTVQQILAPTQQDQGHYEVKVDLRQWPKGMYYCQLTTGQMIKTIPLRKE